MDTPEGAGPVVVDPAAVLNNPATVEIAWVEVQPITGYNPGQDVLSYSGDLISFWDSDFNSNLQLWGAAGDHPRGVTRAALRSVTYTSSFLDTPTTARNFRLLGLLLGRPRPCRCDS